MANYNAIAAISETIISMLRASSQPEGLDDLEFRIFSSRDFSNSSISNGVSLFIYRIFPNGSSRIPVGYVSAGTKQARLLPVDVHFFLTIWGGEASMQHTLVGWMMRVMEDNALLTANAINAVSPGTFRRDETVELGLAEFRTEDLLRIFEALMPNGYQLSIPYYARVIHLESLHQYPDGVEPVQQRQLDFVTQPEPPAFMDRES